MAEVAARLVHLFYLGATLSYVLLGAATAGSPSPTALGTAVVVGLAFHIFGYVANDVIDLPVDRTDPRRMPDPVVRGTVSPEHALLLAVAVVPIALLGGLAPIVAALVFVGAYDIAGKALPVPFVADLLMGATGFFLVVAGASLAGGPSAATWWAGALVAVYLVLVNGVHGGLRDVANDRLAGARTTAVLLGATVARPGVLLWWGTALQAVFGLLLLGLGAGWASAAAYLASWVMLVRAYRARADLRRAMASGTWHLVLLPCAALVAVPASWWVSVALAVAFVAPPLLFGRIVRATPFAMPSTVADGMPRPRSTRPGAALWQMSRIGTPVAAAALVAAGAAISGSLPASIVPAMVAIAFAVVAANVYNDRCDVATDTVNDRGGPVPSGWITPVDCDRAVLASALIVVAASAVVGRPAAIAATVYLVVALAYSSLMRRVLLVGQVAVAVLFAVPVLYGGWIAGDVRAEHWTAAALIVVFLFARETIKAVPDIAGDRAAGYRTIASRFGVPAALRVFRLSAVAFCLASLAATVIVGRVGYLVAALLCGVLPTARTIFMLRGSPPLSAVNAAIAFSGLVFASGLIPVLLMSDVLG